MNMRDAVKVISSMDGMINRPMCGMKSDRNEKH